MTRKGIIYVPMEMICPDRWQYAYDGKSMVFTEEFDDVPETTPELTTMLERSGFEVKYQNNTLTCSKVVSQVEAIRFALGEFLGQATMVGLLSNEVCLDVFKKLSAPIPSLPSIKLSKGITLNL